MKTAEHDTDYHFRVPTAATGAIMTDREECVVQEELLSVLLHDMRSPLGAIGVLADLLSNVSQQQEDANPRQILLLQEAVVKAQRVLDDAVEMQSVLRGSATFTPTEIEVDTLINTCLEKAQHAPYLRNVQVNFNADTNSNSLIRVDIEKAESVILCTIEQISETLRKPAQLEISLNTKTPYVAVHIMDMGNEESPDAAILTDEKIPYYGSLKGRLGTRRLGESRFNLQVCKKVMSLMGGRLDIEILDNASGIILQFPLAVT